MTYEEAIESLLNTCQDLKEAIEQLQEENKFLVETIEKNNLGQIKSERRFLLAQNEQYKRDSDIITEKANQIKSEYESKMIDADKRLIDAKRKQEDINSYINAMSEEKIKGIRSEYEKRKTRNDEIIKKYKAENDKKIQEEEIFFKKKEKKYFLITILSIIFGISGILVNFI